MEKRKKKRGTVAALLFFYQLLTASMQQQDRQQRWTYWLNASAIRLPASAVSAWRRACDSRIVTENFLPQRRGSASLLRLLTATGCPARHAAICFAFRSIVTESVHFFCLFYFFFSLLSLSSAVDREHPEKSRPLENKRSWVTGDDLAFLFVVPASSWPPLRISCSAHAVQVT